MQRLFARQMSTASRHRRHHRRCFPALFVRGGTSNGLVVCHDALPPTGFAASDTSPAAMTARAAVWGPVLAPAMGSPDATTTARQLDGMGSGVSSTSKVCVIAPGEKADRDVSFTFCQVGIRDGRLDLAGNCGNMISAVGPIAFDLGYGGAVQSDGRAVVRIYNTNTDKFVTSTFAIADGGSDGTPPRYTPEGDDSVDGVAGTHSRITLSFLRPAGAKTGARTGLPTGRAVNQLSAGRGATVPASLVDVANPGVFVLGSSLGLDDMATATQSLETNPTLKARVDHLRRAGAERMGLDPAVESVPKIVLLFPPTTTDDAAAVDIRCVALSMGQVHKAVPLTLALCLGAAARIPGTLAAQIVKSRSRGGDDNATTITIGHPSGRVAVGTTLDAGDGTVVSAELHRTARVLMEGDVYY